MEKLESIPVNFWSDFYEDGYVPDGEIQETYCYIEDYNISHEDCEKYLQFIFNGIKGMITDNITLELFFHDSKNDYEINLVNKTIAKYGENFFYKRWEIRFINISHNVLDGLVDVLNEADLIFDGIPFEFYSES